MEALGGSDGDVGGGGGRSSGGGGVGCGGRDSVQEGLAVVEEEEEVVVSEEKMEEKTRSPVVTRYRIEMMTESEADAKSVPPMGLSQAEFDDAWSSWSYAENDSMSSSSRAEANLSRCPSCEREIELNGGNCAYCQLSTPRNLKEAGIPIFEPNEFTLEEKLGKGAFSQVYRGKCRGKDVAIKLLLGASSVVETRENIKFIKEVELLSLLSHPNIVSIMGACRSEENEWGIITEYLIRGDLHSILSQEQSIPVWRKIQFAIDVAEGMAWLTGKQVQILHRDLKPENILVSESWTCKVADFGLSRITSLKEEKIIDRGKGPGSVLWMAPEVLLHRPVDTKLDVYSFGIVVWQIFSQRRPFDSIGTFDEFVEKVGRKGLRPPLNVVPEDLRAIVVRCWAGHPEFRPEFTELIGLLNTSRIDCYFPPATLPFGNSFWKRYFPRSANVRLRRVLNHLQTHFERDIPFEEVTILCLKEILTPKRLGVLTVSIDRFSKFLKWFGDINPVSPIFSTLVNVLKQKWFFGELGSADATRKLEPHIRTVGTYLVRLNPGGNESIQKSPFTISRVNSDQSITHIRIRQTRRGYSLRLLRNDSSLRISTSGGLVELMDKVFHQSRSLCVKICSLYPFAYIFISRADREAQKAYSSPSYSYGTDSEFYYDSARVDMQVSGGREKSSDGVARGRSDDDEDKGENVSIRKARQWW
eukprot:TRINITY_DN11319_c0_g1_i1.p1 TRINITY_DN11319_c0_g1~~TRINITY_DN11319_c0_g1_i1.p1  ORF type:complete len:700 (-),score=125.94 TRINITY_DN11319_c0_g1_i1:110-2209(-)